MEARNGKDGLRRQPEQNRVYAASCLPCLPYDRLASVPGRQKGFNFWNRFGTFGTKPNSTIIPAQRYESIDLLSLYWRDLLPVRWEFGKSYVWAAELMRIKQLCVFFLFFDCCFFLERKEEYGKAMIKIAGCMRDFREKKIPGVRARFQTPTHT